MSRLVAIACLLGATALSAAALAQTSPGASPGTGSKVEALPNAKSDQSGGTAGSSTMPTPSTTAGGSTPGTGSKVEALPAPDRTTPSTAPAVPGQAPRNGEAGRSESGGSAR
jgi:hypothetical protein